MIHKVVAGHHKVLWVTSIIDHFQLENIKCNTFFYLLEYKVIFIIYCVVINEVVYIL